MGERERGRETDRQREREREGERERKRERESKLLPQAKLTQTDNFKVKSVVYLARGGGEEREKRRGREKMYLICNCQESIFTCKIASE